MTNFSLWVQSVAEDIALFLSRIFYNTHFIGFVVGFIFASLIIGYLVTQNPRHIPVMLRYSAEESYNLITKHHPKSKLANTAFHEFIKIYMGIRILLSLVFIIFFAFILISVAKA